MIGKSSTRTLEYISLPMAFLVCHLNCMKRKQLKSVDPVNVYNIMQLDPLPITAEDVRRETQREPVLRQVLKMATQRGVNSHLTQHLSPSVLAEEFQSLVAVLYG